MDTTFRLPKGLIAAAVTPMLADGLSVNLDAVEDLARHLESVGVRGVFVGGTTGEGCALTLAERKALLERWVAVNRNRFCIIAHIGSAIVTESYELARHAESLAVAAVAVVPFLFFKPKNVADLIHTLKYMSSGAPNTPLFYYHNPGLAGLPFKALDIFVAAEKYGLTTLRGAKFTDTDMKDFLDCMQFRDGKYQMIFGKEEHLVSALQLGATTAIGSTYNFSGRICNRMIEAVEAGDTAGAIRLQGRLNALVDVLFKYGLIPSQKGIVELMGCRVGPPRLPLFGLSDAEKQTMKSDLEHAGVWNLLQGHD